MADESYEEWRITGDPGPGYPAYSFTFSPVRGDKDPERVARGHIRLMAEVGEVWRDGPHLHRRRVTVTEWEAIEP